MYIKLNKANKYFDYAKRNEIAVSENNCSDKKCFHPHDFKYVRTDGKLIHSWRCLTRENHGCPDFEDDKGN